MLTIVASIFAYYIGLFILCKRFGALKILGSLLAALIVGCICLLLLH
jgi:hypothetical protein